MTLQNDTAHPAHSCPVQIGAVVEMRDGNHEGTEIYRRDDHDRAFCFVSLDRGRVEYSERCVLLRGVDVETLPAGYPYGCDLDTAEGLVLLGIDYDEDPADFGGELLWDSMEPALDLLDGHPKAEGHEVVVAAQGDPKPEPATVLHETVKAAYAKAVGCVDPLKQPFPDCLSYKGDPCTVCQRQPLLGELVGDTPAWGRCGECDEEVCPEHQRTVDGDTWCSECVHEHEAREGSPPPGLQAPEATKKDTCRHPDEAIVVNAARSAPGSPG